MIVYACMHQLVAITSYTVYLCMLHYSSHMYVSYTKNASYKPIIQRLSSINLIINIRVKSSIHGWGGSTSVAVHFS